MFLNKKETDFVQYCEKIKYYQWIAYLYELSQKDGLINTEDMYCPIDCGDVNEELIWQKSSFPLVLEEYIRSLIEDYKLSPIFCLKLKDSSDLRYMVGVGFHDCPLLETRIKDKEFCLILQCENSFSKPKSVKRFVEICFQGIVEIEKIRENLKNTTGLYYDKQELYCLDNGDLLISIVLNNRGDNFYSKVVEFSAKNIVLKIE